ncbi:MAG: type VI secretion system baseplate subunit TssF [Burkholderiales bacterium]|jgi:type VI secretion system protein ImpG
MRDLLPHYERELSFLADQAGAFAERYPRIAGRLSTSGNLLEDPHVERLVQSFALLSARVHKRLDDDFPRVTEALLEVLYPHYLRPFPACSIACFEGGLAQLSTPVSVPRGTALQTRPVRGVACRFTTAYDVQLMPLRVAGLRWSAVLQAPDGTPLPKGSTSMLSIDLELSSAQVRWETIGGSALRVYLDGDTSVVTALREALLGHCLGTLAELRPGHPWRSVAKGAPRALGFADDEALLPLDARAAQPYRLLTEYFAFPEKFNFIDVALPTEGVEGGRFTLHLPMAGLRADNPSARLLESLGPKNLRLGCTPVINRFAIRAEPIRLTQARSEYPVLPDARRAYAYEVYSVDRVFRVQQSHQGEEIQSFQPFFSLQHDELLSTGENAARYWSTHRDLVTAELSPGFETEITIVDLGFNVAAPQADTLSLDVTATNRDLPNQISIGQSGGDLFMEGGSPAREIQLLRKPTRSERFDCDQGALWQLVSHLSINHLMLGGAGLDGLKELLRLYDLPRSSGTKRLLDGLLRLESKPVVAWIDGEPFPSFVRGTQVQLTVEREAFVGAGMHLFARVLDEFFGLSVQINSFVQLQLLCARSGEVLVDCPRRTGEGPLL